MLLLSVIVIIIVAGRSLLVNIEYDGHEFLRGRLLLLKLLSLLWDPADNIVVELHLVLHLSELAVIHAGPSRVLR